MLMLMMMMVMLMVMLMRMVRIMIAHEQVSAKATQDQGFPGCIQCIVTHFMSAKRLSLGTGINGSTVVDILHLRTCHIWVWVKIRYPNHWMVNTKLD